MSIIIANISNETLKLSDLGSPITYGIKGIMAQNQDLSPGEIRAFSKTNELRNSLLTGDIYKFYHAGLLSIVTGNPYVLAQVVVNGVSAGGSLGLKDVVSIVSVVAINKITNAFSIKSLLEVGGYTADVVQHDQDILCVTDQSPNKLIITYWT